jgi:hypothetical protein
MARGSREDCQEKLDRYMTAKTEYEAYRDDVIVYKASFDLRVAQLVDEDIPARKEKEKERDRKRAEIGVLLGGASKEQAESAESRIAEIDGRLREINGRLNEIMRRLDGEAEPSEVPALFSEGDALAQERSDLLTERRGLVELIGRYNENVRSIQRLDGEVQALEAEIARMQQRIDALESEAAADKNYYEEAQGHADHRKYLMGKIAALWDDYECAVYFGELEAVDEVPLLGDEEIPDSEEEVDTGDYEVPGEIDEPEAPDEGEDWDPGQYDYEDDTGI